MPSKARPGTVCWLVSVVVLLATVGCQTFQGRHAFFRPSSPEESRTVRKPSPSDEDRTDDGEQRESRRPRDTQPDNNQRPPEDDGPQFPDDGDDDDGEKPPELSLNIRVPRQVQLDGGARFTAVIRNEDEVPARDVVLECRLGNGLVFPGHRERFIHRRFDMLSPGESQTISLTLHAQRKGRLCAEFALKLGDKESVWKSVCTEAVAPQYTLQLIVPQKRSVGSRIEPTVILKNRTAGALRNVRLSLFYNPQVLKPQEGSRGSVHRDGELMWDMGTLRAGQQIPLQVEFDCREKSERSCVSVEVTGTDIPSDFRTECFDVVEPAGTYDVRIADTQDLLDIGAETDIVVAVNNRTHQAAAGHPLHVTIPDDVRVVSASAWQGKQKLPLNAAVKDGRVEFDAPTKIDQQGEITYRIRVKALRAGTVEFSASLLSSDNKPLLTRTEPTTIVR